MKKQDEVKEDLKRFIKMIKRHKDFLKGKKKDAETKPEKDRLEALIDIQDNRINKAKIWQESLTYPDQLLGFTHSLELSNMTFTYVTESQGVARVIQERYNYISDKSEFTDLIVSNNQL